MSKRPQIVACLLATAAALTAVSSTSADAPSMKFKQMVVFGDSLVDVGNVFTASGGTFPPPGSPLEGGLLYHDGRFTNEGTTTSNSVWVELLADSLGDKIDPATPFLLGGSNYAFGGTGTGPGFTPPPANSPNLSTQVGIYLSTLGPEAEVPDPSKTLFVLSAGSNDFLLSGQPDPGASAASLVNDVLALAAHGARHIIVPNLARLGQTPAALGTAGAHPLLPLFAPTTQFPGPWGAPLTSPQLDNLAITFNTALDTGLDNLETNILPLLDNNHVEIHRLDVETIFDAILANPGSFGFVNETHPFVFSGLGVASPDQFVFFDPVHPTAAVHEIIASAAYELLDTGESTSFPTVPEPATLGILALMAAPMLRRRR